MEKAEKMDKILSEFKGLRYIADIRNSGRKRHLRSIIDHVGNIQTSEEAILEVFATFYEILYSTRQGAGKGGNCIQERWGEEVPEVTMEDMFTYINIYVILIVCIV